MKKILGIFVCTLLMMCTLPTLCSKVINDELMSYNSCEYTPGIYLLDTTWGQKSLYNDMCPMNTSSGKQERLGCWSVAIGQIINYHSSNYPDLLQSVGVVDYNCTFNFIRPQNIVNNLDDFDYDWSQMADELTGGSSAAEKENVQRLLYDTATVIQKDFGTGSYFTTEDLIPSPDGPLDELITNLTEHFPAINENTEWDYDLTEEEIKEEINDGRPIMFYTKGHNYSGEYPDVPVFAHAFVIDGYDYKLTPTIDYFLVHLNYGWYGENDGWYNYYGNFPYKPNYSFDFPDFRKGLLIRLTPFITHYDGPIYEIVGTECLFTVASAYDTDPPMYYMIDWDDGTPYQWLGPYPLGTICNAYHSWSSPGIYNVKVKVKNNMGCQSDWSEPLTVHITRYDFFLPFLDFLIDLIDQFPILEPYLTILIELICS